LLVVLHVDEEERARRGCMYIQMLWI
jgi:hypothetical protein